MPANRRTVDIHQIEDRLWSAADELRANSGLRESEYSIPVLGLIFLKYADSRFSAVEAEIGIDLHIKIIFENHFMHMDERCRDKPPSKKLQAQ